MIVSCLIMVVFKLGTVNIASQEQVRGIVLKQNEFNYLVNFSGETTAKGYVGDYSKLLVVKDKCIEE